LKTDLIRIDGLGPAAGNRHLIAKDTLVRAAGVGQKDGDDKGADTGCWIPTVNFWFQVSGFRFQETCFHSIFIGDLH
jgi:hypothetical protein